MYCGLHSDLLIRVNTVFANDNFVCKYFIVYFELLFIQLIIYNMKDRLNELLQHYAISKSDFAQRCGISKATISHITSANGRGGHFSEETIEKILEAFPNVSRDWFVNGIGNMTIADDSLHDGTPSLFSNLSKPEVVKANNVNTEEVDVNSEKPISTLPKTRTSVNRNKDEKPYTTVKNSSINQETDNAAEFAAKYIAIDPKSVEKPVAAIERIVIFYNDGTFSQYLPKSTDK